MTAAELEKLLPDREKLPKRIRERVIAEGPAVHAAITELLKREAESICAGEDSPLGHRANHAAKLAGELQVESAIAPLIDIVQSSDTDWMVFNDALFGLRDMGKLALEPILERWDDFEELGGPGEILSHVGKGDPRVLSLLLDWLNDDPEPAAGSLAEFGDPRAIAPLRERLSRVDFVPSDDPMANQVVIELAAAIEELGGELNATESAKVEAVRRGAKRSPVLDDARAEVAPASARPGRNEPCWCGSGAKYKKCHLASDDEAKRSANGPATAASLPDPRGNERTLADLRGMFGRGKARNQSSVDEAQDLMYDAWEARRPEQRIALARQALARSPDCADAYVLLAQESSASTEEAKALYERGVAAGEHALGPKVFTEDAGHFWGLLETRPYMRARHGLAQCLWQLGDRNAAIGHFEELLRLNPNDNQGVRYQLAACLLEAHRDDDLGKLFAEHEGDGSAAWLYSWALLAFRQHGDGERSRRLLGEALGANAHVPAYLNGRKKLPRTLPEYIGIGDENEAVAYVAEHAAAWKSTPGAVEWMRTAGDEAGQRPPPTKSTRRGSKKTTH